MPLVRIDLVEGRTDAELRTLADAVQAVMVEVFDAPEHDRYQVIHEHKPGRILVDDSGLGYQRSSAVVVVQVTQQGRSDEQKSALYRALADRLDREVHLDGDDLVVSVVANGPADWSFGRGRAQFVTGEL